MALLHSCQNYATRIILVGVPSILYPVFRSQECQNPPCSHITICDTHLTRNLSYSSSERSNAECLANPGIIFISACGASTAGGMERHTAARPHPTQRHTHPFPTEIKPARIHTPEVLTTISFRLSCNIVGLLLQVISGSQRHSRMQQV